MLLKKAVVTGATGFLGYALLKELIQNDVFVYALCRNNSSRASRLSGLDNVMAIEADLGCDAKIPGIYGADVFYHLAWEGRRNDFEGQYKNVDMAVNCVRLAAELGCTRFICTGSQAEYGSTAELITEETPLNPATAYGACKTAAYYLTADLAKRIEIEHTWARVFSVYGPNDNPNTLVMTLLRDLKSKGEAKLDTDGEHIWNYLFEEDAARALRLLGLCERSNTVYNVASRDNKPLKEYVGIIRKSADPDSAECYGSQRSAVNLNVCADKLRRDIGEYENTNFEKAIGAMLRK
jgi:nucleoside-diphosphate-sugar epimerase